MNPLVLIDLASRITERLVQSPTVPVNTAEAPVVRREVVQELKPVLEHLTNNEPWYRSRVTIGALVTAGASIASAFGFALAPEDVDVIIGFLTAAGTMAGAGITLYGRWKARKPLGA